MSEPPAAPTASAPPPAGRRQTFLARLGAAVRRQDWFVVGLEVAIVVLGVVIGLQATNWSTSRAEAARERVLLGELRAELAESVEQLGIKRRAFEQTSRSGARAVAFLDADDPCGDACWPVVVDFFHASQWQQVDVPRSTYDELRRNGWPRDRAVVEAMEAYHRQADQFALPLREPPAYRTLVRGLIPLSLHQPYWETCFDLTDGEERYLADCPGDVDPAVAARAVDALRTHPDLYAALTGWAGFTGALDVSLAGQIAAAERALAAVGASLDAR